MRGGAIKSSSDATTTILKKQQTLNALHQTSFLIVISTSIVAFSPLPSLTRHLGSTVTAVTSPLTPQERAVKILSFLSAISAAIELFLSPLIGVWIDLKGRKRPSVLLYSLIAMANLGVVLNPSVGSICISRMVNVLIGGFLMIVANTVIADMFAKNDGGSDKMDDVHGKDQMGTVLGRQAASISLGFLSGSLLGGRLTELGERPAYGCAFLFSTLAALNASFRMVESVDLAKSALGSHEHSWDHASLKQKLLEAPLSSVQLLFHYGKRMRMLALLLLLQSAPVFMGDVFQMFAKEEWGLLPKDFGGIIGKFDLHHIQLIRSNISVFLTILWFHNESSFWCPRNCLQHVSAHRTQISWNTDFLVDGCCIVFAFPYHNNLDNKLSLCPNGWCHWSLRGSSESWNNHSNDVIGFRIRCSTGPTSGREGFNGSTVENWMSNDLRNVVFKGKGMEYTDYVGSRWRWSHHFDGKDWKEVTFSIERPFGSDCICSDMDERLESWEKSRK